MSTAALPLVALCLVCAVPQSVEGFRAGNGANPIRRVVTMLQMMQGKITEEGEREEKMYDKFMCYCQTGGGELQKAIDGAETKIPSLESGVEGGKAEKSQLESDIAQHQKDRKEAKAAVAEATGIRQKEAAAYAKDSEEAKVNIEGMTKAIASLEKGMGGFLQSSAVATVQRLVASVDMEASDREQLQDFLTNGGSAGYSPQSGEITGILKQMRESMTKELSDATADEASAKKDFDALAAAKTREMAALTKMKEEKTARLGDVGEELVNMADDLDHTESSLVEDKKFLAGLAKSCDTKKAEFEKSQKTRSEELLAVSETIKLLNDDDALDLFKKTLPSPSFLQVQVSSQDVVRSARKALADGCKGGACKGNGHLDLIALALRGKKVSFDKVTLQIDEMIALLGKEQGDDNDKKAYCLSEFDSSEDEQKTLERDISDIQKTIAKSKDEIASLSEEVTMLEQGIKDLDAQVKEATAQRKEEHKVYVEDLAANNAAKEIIGIAKNRMNKFYNKGLYKAAPKREMSEEQRISVNMGGTLAPTAPPGGIAGTGVTAFLQEESSTGRKESSSGVIAMMDVLIRDLSKEIQEMEFNEKDTQAEYEVLLEDSAAKRAADAKSVAEKVSVRADVEASLQTSMGEEKTKQKEEMATAKYIHNLHKECDWLITNFDARKEAREGEADALSNAKAVLSGADYSLLQLASAQRHVQ